jgi:hypothetical protein
MNSLQHTRVRETGEENLENNVKVQVMKGAFLFSCSTFGISYLGFKVQKHFFGKKI